jgi:hypothetical protein
MTTRRCAPAGGVNYSGPQPSRRDRYHHTSMSGIAGKVRQTA